MNEFYSGIHGLTIVSVDGGTVIDGPGGKRFAVTNDNAVVSGSKMYVSHHKFDLMLMDKRIADHAQFRPPST